MPAPRDPRDPDGTFPDDEPAGSGPGWIRPSERRPRAEGPTPPGPDPEQGDEADAEDGPRPRSTRPVGAGGAVTIGAAADGEPDGGDAAAADTVAAGAAARSARTTGRHHRRNRRRLVAAGAAAAVVALVVGIVLSSGGGAKQTAERVRLKVPHTAHATSNVSTIATTKVANLTAYAQPATGTPPVANLSAKTSYGLPRTLLVTAEKPGWLEVLLPQRPNDTSGWVPSADVTLSTTTYKITIQLSAHHLWLTNNGQPVLDTEVVVGAPSTPTPTGTFYVTDPLNLTAHPNGAYGAWALGLSGYSNVLMSFDGGPGQIAVHGTYNPSQVGQSISNGCVRVPNPQILQIAQLVPLGTPVVINA